MGGYKVIDFDNTDLVTTNTDGVTIPGIYESIENSYRKPLVLGNLVIDGVEKNDVFSSSTHADNEYTFTAYGHTITISNLDIVKITA